MIPRYRRRPHRAKILLRMTVIVLPLILVGCWVERFYYLDASDQRGEGGSPSIGAALTPPAQPLPAAVPQPAPEAIAPVPVATTEPVAPALPQVVPTEPTPPPVVPAAPVVAKPEAVNGAAARVKYKSGEDPEYAKRCGWPVKCDVPLAGALLPDKRIVAYYGNPLSKRMGALGQYEKDEMLRRLMAEVKRWEEVDPQTPVLPALHLIAVVAQDQPGKAGMYRMVMTDELVERVYGWAKESKALFFIDIQTGHEDIRTLLPRFEWILKNPDVHLGIDPEFNLVKSLAVPGTKIGTYDAEEINFVTGYLAGLVKKYQLPPKVLTVHRFTRPGVTNTRKIVLRPEVQVVMHMDGWGAPWLKRDSYKDYIVAEPVQYTGFKIFYRNDTKKGDPLLTPEEVMRLNPKPVYIQYQ